MAKTIMCPFYRWEKRLAVHCESAHMEFDDLAERQEHMNEYCGSVEGWRHCTIARRLELRYEKKETG